MDLWLIINEKMATLQEIENHWSLDDMIRCLSFISIKSDMEYQRYKEQNAKK